MTIPAMANTARDATPRAITCRQSTYSSRRGSRSYEARSQGHKAQHQDARRSRRQAETYRSCHQLEAFPAVSLRTIAAHISSVIQPSTSPSAGLSTKVARAATPITGQHDGRASNNRREIAKSVPAMISSAPTAPIGIIANRDAALSANPIARMSSNERKMIGASPVRAPKRY
jgi:hypothetical protein